MSAHRITLFVAIGAVLYLILQAGTTALGWLATADTEESIPLWYALVSAPLHTLAIVLPGLLVGFLAGSRGALLGFLTGLVGAVADAALTSVNWSSFDGAGLVDYHVHSAQLLVLALGPAIIGLVSGAAGQLFAGRRAEPGPAVDKPA